MSFYDFTVFKSALELVEKGVCNPSCLNFLLGQYLMDQHVKIDSGALG